MSTEAGIWTESFRVRAYETDLHGCASIQTLCNYFQAAAGNHARTYGVSIDNLNEQDLTWVLSRLHVRMDAYPVWGDEVLVETWPSGLQGILAIRDFYFHGAPQDDGPRPVLGRGASAWIVVDVKRKRPVRFPAFIRDVKRPERPSPLPDAFGKMTPPTETDHEHRFHVRYSDLDINRHVNNARYAAWAVESVPEEVLHACRLRELELQFRAETTFADTVVVQTQMSQDDAARSFVHRLVRQSDGRDAALARTQWVRREESENR